MTSTFHIWRPCGIRKRVFKNMLVGWRSGTFSARPMRLVGGRTFPCRPDIGRQTSQAGLLATAREYDVPNERFISYSYTVPDDEAMLGWAGWNHIERARVLIDLIESRKGDDEEDLLTLLLAGLKELRFWVRQWRDTGEVIEYLEREQSALGLSGRDLMNWRPPKPKRGRPRKQRVS